MDNRNNKASLPVAAQSIHRFPKKYPHITTSDFMQFNIATVMELPPKSSLSCVHKSYLRTFALKRPLYSNVTIKKQAYFVPYRTIWQPFTDFREDVPHNTPSGTTLLSNTPLIELSTLVDIFKESTYSSAVSTTPTDFKHGCDFVSWDSNAVEYFHTFTDYGRWCYKLLTSMGLKVPFADAPSLTKDDTISALPLLAVAKVYMDYFYPNQYAHYGSFATIDGIFQRHYIYTLSKSEIELIFAAIAVVAYDDDYFVSAFDHPVTSADGVQSVDFKIKDISLSGATSNLVWNSNVQQADTGTPIVNSDNVLNNQTTRQVYNFTQYVDSHLKALTDYIKRHSLAGSRSLNRYLADWGVTLTADKLMRCFKLGEVAFPLQVADVISTSDTFDENSNSGAQLGDMAGRSVAFNGDFSFDCDTDEDGLLVVTCSILPDSQIVQGFQRYWWHKTKLDFLNGDFDGLSIREIRQSELFVGTKRPSNSFSSGIFGFCPSYAEYKIDYAIIDGDFSCDTKNLGLYGFELARMFSDEIGDTNFNEVHGLNFVLGNDASQYNRIFYNDDESADKFILVHRCDFNHRMPAVPLYDSFDFEDGKKNVIMSVNGAKDN